MSEVPTNVAECMTSYAGLKDDATDEKLAEHNRLSNVKNPDTDIMVIGKGFRFYFTSEGVKIACCVLPIEVYAYPDELTDDYVKAHFENAERNGGDMGNLAHNELMYDLGKEGLQGFAMMQIRIRNM